MSEILPPHQNERQTWQQELRLHRDFDGRLQQKETIALIGSFTEASLEGEKLDNEYGTLSDLEFSKKQRTRTAALEQLASLKGEPYDSVTDLIADRRVQLEAALAETESDTRRYAEGMKLHEQLAGLKLLDEKLQNVEDNIDSLASVTGDFNSNNQYNRAAAINELIKQHNEEVSSSSESIAGSTEAQEAQARVDAHYADQIRQPQPTETVDDARRKVAEAYGDTGEKMRQALIGEVAEVAKGATRILTDIPSGAVLKSKQGDYQPRDGFMSFGDGLDQDDSKFMMERLSDGSHAEAFMVEPDVTAKYKTVTETVETGGRFRKKTHQVERRVPDGELPAMVTNPLTGKQEQGVKVAYQFNGNVRGGYGNRVAYEGPQYKTETGRAGNMLLVEATLPQSVADKLKQEVARDPSIAREFAKTLAIQNGITEQAWTRIVSPPFDQLTSDWETAITDLQKDTKSRAEGHNVVSRKTVKSGNNNP